MLLPSGLSPSVQELHLLSLSARGLYRRWGLAPRPEDGYATIIARFCRYASAVGRPAQKTPRHEKAAQPPLRLEMPARSGAFSGAAPREMRAADAGFGKGQPDAGTGTDRKKRRRQRHRANGTSARTFPVSENLPPTRAAGTSGRSRRRPRDVYPEHCHCAAAANVVGY